VCLSVRVSLGLSVRLLITTVSPVKRLNQSTHIFGVDPCGPKEPNVRWGYILAPLGEYD